MQSEILAQVPLASGSGSFVVRSSEEDGTIGVLAMATTLGPICVRCELPDAPRGYAAGRALTELEIAPYDFAAAAINDVLQDAVGAAARYTQTIGRFESPDTHAAFHVIMRAALHDESCRQYMTDLVNLSRAHTNEEFNFIQSHLSQAPGSLSAALATMTPDQVQALAARYRRAYDLIQDALPWLTEGLRTLLGQLQQGEFVQARETMIRRYKDRYVDQSARVQDEVGRDSPIEHYTVGGAPINVGKYRECVGCTCADPCADGSCESCCECSKTEGHEH
jgi:hypothetical protein